MNEVTSSCQCGACVKGTIHASDCAVHNMPYMDNGPCDCSPKVSLTADDIHWFEDAFRAWDAGDMGGVLDGLNAAVNAVTPYQPQPVAQDGCNNCGGLGYRSEANGEQISCDLCETSPSDAEIEELGEYIARHLGDKHWQTYEAMKEALAIRPVAQGEAVDEVYTRDNKPMVHALFEKAKSDFFAALGADKDAKEWKERPRIEWSHDGVFVCYALSQVEFNYFRKGFQAATPTIPTGQRVVPDEWTKIGFVERSALARLMQGSKQAETLFVVGGGCQPQDVYVNLTASPSAGGV